MKAQVARVNIKWLNFCRVVSTPITRIKHGTKHPIPEEPIDHLRFTFRGYQHAKRNLKEGVVTGSLGTALSLTAGLIDYFVPGFMLENTIGTLMLGIGLIFLIVTSKYGRKDASKVVARRVELYDSLIQLREEGKTFQEIVGAKEDHLDETEVKLLKKYARRTGFIV